MMNQDNLQTCRSEGQTESLPRQTYRPNLDLLEGETELTLRVDLPGVKPDDIDIQFERGSLRLSAPLSAPIRERPHPGQTLLNEYGIGDYLCTLRVGDGIDPSGIRADYSGGVLTLQLPKLASLRPRRIIVGAE